MGLLAKRQFLASSLVATGCNWILPRLGSWRGLLVLNYHRVGDPAGACVDHDLYSATTAEFAWQLQYIQRNFEVVGLHDLERVQANPRGRYVLISFDDGYRDNYTDAFPALRDLGIPAVFFIATGFIDRPRLSWWDEIAWMVRTTQEEALEGHPWLPQPILIDHLQPQVTIRTLLKVYKSLPGDQTEAYLNWLGEVTGRGRATQAAAESQWMTWDMLREMQQGGMSFGGHTVNHPILARLPAAEQQREIETSCRRLQEELGVPVTSFSYPVGGRDTSNQATRDILQARGIRWAFRFGIGYQPDTLRDPLQIPRLAVEQTDNRTMFRALTTLPQLFD